MAIPSSEKQELTEAELTALAALSAAEVLYATLQLYFRVKNDIEIHDQSFWFIGGPSTTRIEEELKRRGIL